MAISSRAPRPARSDLVQSAYPGRGGDDPRPGRGRLVDGRGKMGVIVGGLMLALFASALSAVALGQADLSVADVWSSLLHRAGLAEQALPSRLEGIVWLLRLPRVLTAIAVGAVLACCGAAMQTLTRNALADPYLLGLSSGAALGAVLTLALGVLAFLPIAAFAGAAVAMSVTLLIARSGSTLSPGRTVLAGVAVGQLASAATSFLIFWSSTGDSYREILSWLMGSLAGTTFDDVALTWSFAVPGVLLLLFGSRVLDAFTFGDRAADSLGFEPQRARWVLLVLIALLTGLMVAVSGAIGFVGLMVPHAVRLVVGSAHRKVLPISALTGGLFLLWADTLARTIFEPQEVPVGVITALLGVPAFIWLLRRRSS